MNSLRWRLVIATLVSPSVAVAFYSIVCLAQLGHFPRRDEAWLYLVIFGVAAIAYLVTFLVTVILLASGLRARSHSYFMFGATGLALGILVAGLLDLPSLNFARIEYYGLVAASSVGTALVYRALLYGLRSECSD